MYSNAVWEDYTVHCFPISENVSLIYNVDRKEWCLRKDQDPSFQEEDEILIEDEETPFPEDGMTAFGVFLSIDDFSYIKQELYDTLGL